MSESVAMMLEKLSRELVDRCQPDVRGVIIARDDGLLIHAYIAYEVPSSSHTIAAMLSVFMGPSRKVYRSLMNSTLDEAMLSGPEGKIIVRSLSVDEVPEGRKIYVGVVTNREPNIGLVLLEFDKYIEAVRKILIRR
ncbi:MAG: hypothetical protein GXO23_02820 [Crenarchaeota archaeon]|nr:hypothetical protein [Thermoproteota archaeon]